MALKIEVLLFSENEQDYSLIKNLLGSTSLNGPDIEWVDNCEDALRCFHQGSHNLYLFDYQSVQRCGLEFLNRVRQDGRRYVPVIFLNDQAKGFEIDKFERRVADCLIKSQLSTALLERSIRMALQQKVDESQLLKLAHYDQLTGLANRELFRIGLMEHIIQSRRTRRQLAVILIDLDNFKDINDSLGHPVGDALLSKVADRLRRGLRESDIVARLGGDEFAVVATHLVNTSSVSSMCSVILNLFSEAFTIDDRSVMIGASVGVSVYPGDSADPDELLMQADLALYKAKGGGRNCFHFFDQGLESDLKERQRVQNDLREALVNEQFYLVYQPIVNVDSLQIQGVEALIRCQDQNGELMSPELFIPVAEAGGLIFPIGEWVIKQVFRDLKKWRSLAVPAFSVAINVSAIQLRNDKIVQIIKQQLQECDVDPSLIHLEITESMLLNDSEDIVARIHKLSNLGIKISIDDFGTGYSSLAYLKNFPIDIIKVDKTLTQGALQNKQDAAIATAIMSISKAFDAEVVAEGVEGQEHHQFLVNSHCELMQGYYICRPARSEQLLAWLRDEYPAMRMEKRLSQCR
jgi:diguanylate cyclase (GGDEF)-like protein